MGALVIGSSFRSMRRAVWWMRRPLEARQRTCVASGSPDVHASVDDNVDAGDVRALVRGQEKRDVRHLLRAAETTQERLAEHVVSPLRVVELVPRGVAFDQPR